MSAKQKWLSSAVLAVLAVLAIVTGPLLGQIKEGQATEFVSVQNAVRNAFTVSTAEAAGTADYTCDGAADDVQGQAAVTALPAGGGAVTFTSGTYVFAAAVTRAIDNITIEGEGRATYFTRDAATTMWTAGGNNWVFSNLRVDVTTATFLAAMGATTGWIWENVWTSDTGLIPFRSQAGTITAPQLASTVAIGTAPLTVTSTTKVTNLNADTIDGYQSGRSSTYTVAASNASASWLAQADYIADGTADEVQIQAAITAIPAAGGTLVLSDGTFTIAATVTIDRPLTLLAGKAKIVLANNADVTMVQVSGSNGVVIDGGEWDGNRANQAAISYGFNVSTSNRFTIRNAYIHDIKATGIAVHMSQGVWIVDNVLENIGFNDGGAIYAVSDGISTDNLGGAGNDIHIIGNRISNVLDEGIGLGAGLTEVYVQGNSFYTNDKAISMNIHAAEAGSSIILIDGNHISGVNEYGIKLFADATSTGNTRYITVTNNKIYQSTAVAIQAQGKIVNIIINDNWLYEQIARAIYVLPDGASYPGVSFLNRNQITRTGTPTGPAIEINALAVHVQNNTVSWTAQPAIWLNPPAANQYVVVTGNQIYKTGVGSGLRLTDVEYSVISNNAFFGTYTGGAFALLEEATAQENIISNNNIIGVTTAGQRFSSTGTNTQIRSNKGYIAPGEHRTYTGSLASGNANAFTFAWQNPEGQAVIVSELMVDVTTVGGTPASVLDAGTAADGTTHSSDLIVGADLNALNTYVSAARPKLAANGGATDWITGQILTQNAANLAGKYYVEVIGQ